MAGEFISLSSILKFYFFGLNCRSCGATSIVFIVLVERYIDPASPNLPLLLLKRVFNLIAFKMRFSLASLAVIPLASAQLNKLAVQAGLKYFGTASDIVSVKALDATYASILSNKKEFGQLTAANGQKVCSSRRSEGDKKWGNRENEVADTNGGA